MSKHTPGPWKSWPTPNAPDFTHEIGGDGLAICSTYACNADSFANARLIAAAPSMLAALQYIANLSPDGGYGDPLSYAQEEARQAIAKATGESA